MKTKLKIGTVRRSEIPPLDGETEELMCERDERISEKDRQVRNLTAMTDRLNNKCMDMQNTINAQAQEIRMLRDSLSMTRVHCQRCGAIV